ncbi:MAG: hypothetical protein QNJ53_11970 [Pleurocapsa sp. MO_192.B19]|nr:hypothetical protein [Pleurocapsa sp. MO_192.B19]
MLSQIVRPLVDTQIRRLASSQATYSTLVETIAKWLSYLGVKAQVTHLANQSGQIQVSLTVGKPNTCASDDWQQILHNLEQQQSASSLSAYNQIIPSQKSKLQRLFAYLIQTSQPDKNSNLNAISHRLNNLNLDEFMLLGIRSALKVPQSIDRLLKELDPDVVALALPQAVEIALADQKLNRESETVIVAMLKATKSNS